MFDALSIKKDFLLLGGTTQLVYLDSTATSLKPHSVVAKENEYYEKYSANIFRGIYKISEKATAEYEQAREKVARFINAETNEIVFTRNTTESINLVMNGLSRTPLHNHEFVTTIMEHHSNFVPWQQLTTGFQIPFNIVSIDEQGKLNFEEINKLVTKKTKLLAVTAVSNVLGTINPIKTIVRQVKKINPHCLVMVDGAQAVPHMEIDVKDWGADFVVFSSHKMLGPTGVGVLWGKYAELEKLSPYQYGGEMIEAVYRDKSSFKPPPHKFEAGTPHIAGVISLGAAIDYLEKIGMKNVREHEQTITEYALEELQHIKGIRIVGPHKSEDRGGVIAFTMEKIHAHDIAQILDSNNVCIRSGHHCAMPLHISLQLQSTARASFYIYTTKEDVDALIVGLEKVKRVFS